MKCNLNKVFRTLRKTFTDSEINETCAHSGIGDNMPENCDCDYALTVLIVCFAQKVFELSATNDKHGMFKNGIVDTQAMTEYIGCNFVYSDHAENPFKHSLYYENRVAI